MPGGVVDDMMVHTVTVETLNESGAYGDTFAAPRELRCYVRDRVQQVRSSTGEQVVSLTELTVPIGDVDAYTPGSRVTVHGDRQALVVSRGRHDAGPLFADLAHGTVQLT
jgi:hypothetical protein